MFKKRLISVYLSQMTHGTKSPLACDTTCSTEPGGMFSVLVHVNTTLVPRLDRCMTQATPASRGIYPGRTHYINEHTLKVTWNFHNGTTF